MLNYNRQVSEWRLLCCTYSPVRRSAAAFIERWHLGTPADSSCASLGEEAAVNQFNYAASRCCRLRSHRLPERNRKIDDWRDGNGVNREKEIARASKNTADDAYKYLARRPRGEGNRKTNAPAERNKTTRGARKMVLLSAIGAPRTVFAL